MRLLCAFALIATLLRAQTIEGTATDALTGLPLPGVAVHLYKTGGMPARHVITDNLGRFRIEGLPEGGYFALVRKDGYSVADANNSASAAGSAGDPSKTISTDAIVRPSYSSKVDSACALAKANSTMAVRKTVFGNRPTSTRLKTVV